MCLHEAAHEIYYKRAGIGVNYHGPFAEYADGGFYIGALAVELVDIPSELDALEYARGCVAGGVAPSVLINSTEFRRTDTRDRKTFSADMIANGLTPKEISELWNQATETSKKTYEALRFGEKMGRSPSFCLGC